METKSRTLPRRGPQPAVAPDVGRSQLVQRAPTLRPAGGPGVEHATAPPRATSQPGGGEPIGIGARASDVRLSPVVWMPSARMDRERWIAYGKELGRAGNGSKWWLGDWLRYGNVKYGERYSLASAITGYDEQTLMNYAYVARRLAPLDRRADLSWSHHAEVAKLPRGQQTTLLDRAVGERLSVKALRVLVRAHSPIDEGPSRPGAEERPGEAQVCPHCGRPLDE